MICYRCHTDAGDAAKCPLCGADLGVFRRIRRISNAYYNEGYEKACVRDLSGAVTALRQSLKFNKYNTEARNLLGLVYYESGELVEALGEWVVSTNFQPQDNLANAYLKDMRENTAMMNQLSQTVRKYNQALEYCRQGDLDLAVIQLRKVISLNPHMVKAYQLLALLYLKNNQLDKAQKALKESAKIDTANTITLRYTREVNRKIRASRRRKAREEEEEEELLTFRSGNDTVIMPRRFRENSMGTNLTYLAGGLLLGCLVTAFLVAPHVRSNAVQNMSAQILAANESIATDAQTIDSLREQLEELQQSQEDSQGIVDTVSAKIDAYQALLNAYVTYYTTDSAVQTGKALDNVEADCLEADGKIQYQTLKDQVYDSYMASRYNSGYNSYSTGVYTEAITDLQAVVDYDEDFQEGYAVYYLAMAYEKNGQTDQADEYFQYISDHYPDTQRARSAENYLSEHNAT